MEPSNLHRQVAHDPSWLGKPKAASLAAACGRALFPPTLTASLARFSAATAPALLRGVHIVVDATDNPRARYLISDACLLVPKEAGLPAPLPVVSGAALGIDGQVSVHHWGEGGGCMRCAFPTPPPPSATPACADSGVLGPVTGVVGCLMAMEVLKCAAAWARGEGPKKARWGGDGEEAQPLNYTHPQLLLHTPTLPPPGGRALQCLDASIPRLRVLQLAGKKEGCALCGLKPTIQSLDDAERWADEAGLAGGEGGVCPLEGGCGGEGARATTEQLAILWAERGAAHHPGPLLIDVRSNLQRDLCLPCGLGCKSVHLPLAVLQAAMEKAGVAGVRAALSHACGTSFELLATRPLLCICRRGMDSSEAARLLLKCGAEGAANVGGGWGEWAAAARGAAIGNADGEEWLPCDY